MCKIDVKTTLIPCFKLTSTNHGLQIKLVILTVMEPKLTTERKLTQTQVQLNNAHVHESAIVH